MKTTDFFTTLDGMSLDGTLTLVIKCKPEGLITVSTIFKRSALASTLVLPPMLFRETPENLDAIFFNEISAPLAKIVTGYINRDEVNNAIDKGEGMAKSVKRISANSTDKRKEYEISLKQVEDFNAVLQYGQAIELIKKMIPEFPEKTAELKKTLSELESKNAQLDFFKNQ